MLDKTVVAKWFVILYARFGQKPLTSVVFDLYVEAIEEDIKSTEDFVFACKKIFKYNKSFPTPAEFAEAIEPIESKLEKDENNVVYKYPLTEDLRLRIPEDLRSRTIPRPKWNDD